MLKIINIRVIIAVIKINNKKIIKIVFIHDFRRSEIIF